MIGRNRRIFESALLGAVQLTRDGDDVGAMGAIVTALDACDGADPMRAQLERLLALARADGDAPELAPPPAAALAALLAWAEGLWASDTRIEALRAAAGGDVRSTLSLAIALTAWARRAAAHGRIYAAAPACREAAALLRGVAAQELDRQFRLADCLKLLGAVEASVGNGAEAAKAAAEACRMFRTLSEREPDLLPHLASALHNMAGVRLRCDDPVGAVSAAREAVALRRQLAACDMARADLAESLSQSSLALQAAELGGEAKAACAEAASIYRGLAAGREDLFAPSLASALRLGAQQALAEQCWGEGLETLEEEIALYRRAPDAQAAARPLAEALHNRGVFQSMLGDEAAALESAREAVAVRRGLPRRAPTKDRLDLAASLSFLGALAARLDLGSEAAAAFDEAVGLLKPLRDGSDMEVELALARAAIELSASRAGLNEIAAAAAATDIAAGAFACIARVRGEPADIGAQAQALLQSGNLLRRAGAGDKAIEAYAAAATMRGALNKAGGDEQSAIAAAQKLVICLKRAGRVEEARDWAERLGRPH